MTRLSVATCPHDWVYEDLPEDSWMEYRRQCRNCLWRETAFKRRSETPADLIPVRNDRPKGEG